MNEVALLFDDGPNPKITPKLLDILKEKHVPANFFVIGAWAKAYPEIVRLILQNGHEIGNHTYAHHSLTQVLKEKGEAGVKDEIEHGALAIKEAAASNNLDITFLRPPFLDWSEAVANVAAPLYGSRIVMSGLAVGDYDWGVDHYWNEMDKAAVTAQAGRIIHSWQGAAGPGTLLGFHDGAQYGVADHPNYETWMNRSLPTLEAIPQIIDDLRSQGLTVKRLSEMKLLYEKE